MLENFPVGFQGLGPKDGEGFFSPCKPLPEPSSDFSSERTTADMYYLGSWFRGLGLGLGFRDFAFGSPVLAKNLYPMYPVSRSMF